MSPVIHKNLLNTRDTMRKTIIILVLALLPGLCLADDHTRTAAIYKCKLHEGKEMEEVMAVNKRWLANARALAGSEEVNSYAMEPKVGDFRHFMFIDSYPDVVTWAKVQQGSESEESKSIEDALNEVMTCEKNRLYESTKTMP